MTWGGLSRVGGMRPKANRQKKAPLARRLGNHTSFGCWFMFEFFDLFVSSALGMQVLLCIEWEKCK